MNVRQLVLNSIETKLKIALNDESMRAIETAGNAVSSALLRGHKILIAGNGGSAADAQHFAAELAGKFMNPDRIPLPAIALTTNTSNLTAIGNDFGYSHVFSRQTRALGAQGDIFVGISTSGNSDNIVSAVLTAKKMGLATIGLLGNNGGVVSGLCDLPIVVPSDNTQNIQEAHIMIIHILCQMVDEAFSGKG